MTNIEKKKKEEKSFMSPSSRLLPLQVYGPNPLLEGKTEILSFTNRAGFIILREGDDGSFSTEEKALSK